MKRMSKEEFKNLPQLLQEEIKATFRKTTADHYNIEHKWGCWGSCEDDEIDDLYDHEYVGTVFKEDIND
jgi:hypothetical protein